MIVTGQALAHPGQIVQRVLLFEWHSYKEDDLYYYPQPGVALLARSPAVRPVYADGTWRADIIPGDYGLIYFGAKPKAGQTAYFWPKPEAADATFAGRQPYTRPAFNQANAQLSQRHDNCQPVCHGTYRFVE